MNQRLCGVEIVKPARLSRMVVRIRADKTAALVTGSDDLIAYLRKDRTRPGKTWSSEEGVRGARDRTAGFQ